MFTSHKPVSLKYTQALTFAEFPPVADDHINGTRPESDWLAAPFSVADNTDPAEESNFDAFLNLLDDIDPNGRDWCVASFPHWDVGLCQFVFYKPTEALMHVVAEAMTVVGKEGLLDFDLYAEYKAEAEACKVLST